MYVHVTYITLFLPKSLYFRTKRSFITPLFSQFVLCNASNNTTSRNIGRGTDAWAVPHLKFGGTVPPVPLKSSLMSLTRTLQLALYRPIVL